MCLIIRDYHLYVFIAIIYFYNQESGGTKNSNPLLEYIKNKGMKIQNKFRKYFSKDDINKYIVCFDK